MKILWKAAVAIMAITGVIAYIGMSFALGLWIGILIVS
jgi:hypothetical protein